MGHRSAPFLSHAAIHPLRIDQRYRRRRRAAFTVTDGVGECVRFEANAERCVDQRLAIGPN